MITKIAKIFVIGALLLHNIAFANGSTSFAVIDIDGMRLIASQNLDQRLSIASITKMMTALVVLKSNQDLDELIPVQHVYSSNFLVKGKLAPGIRISRRNMLELALVSSDNRAAYSLAAAWPGGVVAFVKQMNLFAELMEMEDTDFVDPVGILPGNKSTVHDIAIMTIEAAKYHMFQKAATTPVGQMVIMQPIKTKKKKQTVIVKKTIFFGKTNRYSSLLHLWAAKTGYTSQAGRCLTMMVNKGSRNIVIVVLNAQSNFERTELIDRLLEMYVDNFKNFEYNDIIPDYDKIIPETREETYDMLHPDT